MLHCCQKAIEILACRLERPQRYIDFRRQCCEWALGWSGHNVALLSEGSAVIRLLAGAASMMHFCQKAMQRLECGLERPQYSYALRRQCSDWAVGGRV